MKKIILASKNKGKLAELEAPLKALGFEVSLLPANYPDIVEDGDSFEENALIKARFVCQDLGLPALADDSGICVDALEGAPGIYSARYANDYASDWPSLKITDTSATAENLKEETQDEKNNRKLLEKMQGVKGHHRTCAFHCAMALVFPKTEEEKNLQNFAHSLFGQEIVVHEKWEGLLLEYPCGDKGFGYDPLFFDEELQCASAQMPKEVKMARSHRGKALNALFEALKRMD